MSDLHVLKKPAIEQVQSFAADASLAIDIGDLLYLDTDDAKPASSLADQLSEGANQQLFASKFCGIANSKRLASQNSAGEVSVQVDGLIEYPCVSATFEIGDLVGASENSNGDGLLDQQVEKVTDPAKAIGVVTQRYTSPTTRVWFRLQSRVSENLALVALSKATAGSFRVPFVPTAAAQAMTTAGAVNVTSFYTSVNTTNGSGHASTLAAGTIPGQLKKVQLIVDGGDLVLTVPTLAGGNTITFADAGDYVLLMWDGAAWNLIEAGNDADGATAPVVSTV